MRVNQRFVGSNLIWGAKQFTSEILRQEVDLPGTGTVAKWPKWRHRPLSHETFKTARATRSSSPRLFFSASLHPLFVWLTAECIGKTQPRRFRVDIDVPLGRRPALTSGGQERFRIIDDFVRAPCSQRPASRTTNCLQRGPAAQP